MICLKSKTATCNHLCRGDVTRVKGQDKVPVLTPGLNVDLAYQMILDDSCGELKLSHPKLEKDSTVDSHPHTQSNGEGMNHARPSSYVFLARESHCTCLEIDIFTLQVSYFIQAETGGIEDGNYCSISNLIRCSFSLNR
jgi:hypothetical protein